MGGITAQRGGTGGASKALSNLANCAINVDLLPDTDSTLDLGTTGLFWKTLCVDEIVGPAVFNEAGADIDFRFEGDTEPNLLFLDASTDRVGIGTANPSSTLEVNGDFRIVGMTSGSVLFSDSNGQITQDNANFFWDNTNNRLGINEATPQSRVEITGTINALADLAVEQQYHLKLHQTTDTTGHGAGISFGMSSADNQQTAAIVAKRTGSNGQGALQFYTKQSTLTGVAPVLVLALDENGNVGIGVESPAISALLELSSTTGALLVTRMNNGQRNGLTAVDGMIIYNTTANAFNFRENGSWVTK